MTDDNASEILVERVALEYALAAVRGREPDNTLVRFAGQPYARVASFAAMRRAIELIADTLPLFEQAKPFTREDVVSALEEQLAAHDARHPAVDP